MESDLRSETISASRYKPGKIEAPSGSQAHSQNISSVETRASHGVESAVEAKISAATSSKPDYELPKTRLGALSLLAGFRAGVALLMPALYGGVLGWWLDGTMDLLGLSLTLISFFCLLIGFIIFSEYSDYRYCQRPESKYIDNGNHVPGMNLISAGRFQTGFVIGTGAILLLVGLLCNLILAVTIASWPVLFFFVTATILVAMYMVPPPWHGYLAWGVGELGILIGVGVIPLVSSYYVQRGMVDSLALLAGIPFGAFAVLVLFSRSLIRQRSDWMLRKRTLAVVLGEQRSINFLIVFIVIAYASLLLVVSITSLPLLLMVGLATLPIALRQFKRAEEVLHTPTERYYLHQLMLKVMLYTALLLIGLLILEKLW